MKKFFYLFLLAYLFLAGCSTKSLISSEKMKASDIIITGQLTIVNYTNIEGSGTLSVSGNIITYVSPELKIKFNIFYPNNQPDLIPSIHRSGNIISIGSQYLEVFKKETGESVEHAIRRLFLTNKSKKCIVIHNQNSTNLFPKIGGMDTYTIDYPNSMKDHKIEDCDGLCYPDEFCSTYALGGEFKFFIGDSYHDTLVFINVGQDSSILGDNQKMRYETVKILDDNVSLGF